MFQFAWGDLCSFCLSAHTQSVGKPFWCFLSPTYTQKLTTSHHFHLCRPIPNHPHLSDCCKGFLASFPACIMVPLLKRKARGHPLKYIKSYYLFCLKFPSLIGNKSHIPCNGTSLTQAVPVTSGPHLPPPCPHAFCPSHAGLLVLPGTRNRALCS